MLLDFKEMAEAVKRNNMGLGGFKFQAQSRVEDGKVTLQPTGQAFILRGNPPVDGASAWRTMNVVEWLEPARTVVEILQ